MHGKTAPRVDCIHRLGQPIPVHTVPVAEDRVSLARPSLEATVGTTLAVGLLIPDSFSASAYPLWPAAAEVPLGPMPPL